MSKLIDVSESTPPIENHSISIPIPNGFPMDVYEKVQKALKEKNPDGQRSLAFQNRSQRNVAFLNKGLTKPGKISYDTLRRAAMSVHIIRICIQTLKQKVTKTKWVIQNTDINKRKIKGDDKRIKEIEELLRHPNSNNESFRTLMDKIIEDLLVLDAVSLEKTRYPDGKLAELFFVDSSTIRPVYDEKGDQDIEIPLKVKGNDGEIEDLEVSYVQVLNNSQYGGPESGDIVAAWPKKDFIHFHMNPQGAMEAFGYGLSPIEGILSVVANILNADNYNSTYFEEGAFPPIILQLIGQVNQRDLEAYREYLVSELTGNFHRPAIMATEKAESLQIHNLKDNSNRDMQFMEYQNWLAKLCCAMYGLSPQDIGLTDTTGSKSVADEQSEISNSKGYSSILHLLQEVINEDIIWKDLGYEDLEFHWVATDIQNPQEESMMYDRDLRNGTLTLNEVREKRGEIPYAKWADEPMILTGEGYQPLDPKAIAKKQEEDAKIQEENAPEVPEQFGQEGKKLPFGKKPQEKPQDKTVDEKFGNSKNAKKVENKAKTIRKSVMEKAVYTQSGFRTWFDDRGYSQPFIWMDVKEGFGAVIKPPVAVNLQSQELEIAITTELSARGLNVNPVNKASYVEILNLLRTVPEIYSQFMAYVNMEETYDSEKWRARNGGSRKYPYYLVTDYIDGYSLSDELLISDMKRDPNSYRMAIRDLARLWRAEKEMVLGDRRTDQYIITHDKRAYGFDYQFKGDLGRWEKSERAIHEALRDIPELLSLFETEIVGDGIFKRMLKSIIP
jgi:phage portal protein BeeE